MGKAPSRIPDSSAGWQSRPRAVASRRVTALAALAMVLALAACRASGAGGLEERDSTRITAEELGRVTTSNVYEAVTQLRPLWLQSRGRRSARLSTEIVVAQNGAYFGPASSLRLFSTEDVRELRYMDGSRASAYLSGLGSRHVEGAIIVVLHGSGPDRN